VNQGFDSRDLGGVVILTFFSLYISARVSGSQIKGNLGIKFVFSSHLFVCRKRRNLCSITHFLSE
jgi:hypothetical protein